MVTTPTPLTHPIRPRLRVVLAVLAVGIALGAGLVLVVEELNSSPAGVEGSGIAATQPRAVAPFHAVELAGSNVITVHVGQPRSVVVHADHNLLDRVTTTVQAGTLVIGTTPGSFTTHQPMRVEVGVPTLDAVRLTGSGILAVAGIDATSLAATLPGTGVLRLGGRANRLDVTLGGSGDAQLEQLAARDVHAVVSGSGRILVTATRSLKADVPGSGAILYRGNPQVTANVTGSGAVARG